MGILSGKEIIAQIDQGNITISPFDTKYINPVSVDLHLGEQIVQYKKWTDETLQIIDVKEEPAVDRWIMSEGGSVLWPGKLYLMHTIESIRTTCFVPVLDGKSSLARLGIVIHLTAGFGDPGFSGQYTLEVTAVHPVRVYAGMPFCQMRFHEITGPLMDYQKTGHYIGEQRGPQPSKLWMSMRRK
jgi:dCTP deaminase